MIAARVSHPNRAQAAVLDLEVGLKPEPVTRIILLIITARRSVFFYIDIALR